MLHSAFLPEAVKLILRLNAILENQFRKANIGGGFCFSLQQLARMSRPKKSWPSLPRIWHAKYDILSKGNLHHSKSDAFIHQVVRCIQISLYWRRSFSCERPSQASSRHPQKELGTFQMCRMAVLYARLWGRTPIQSSPVEIILQTTGNLFNTQGFNFHFCCFAWKCSAFSAFQLFV